MLGSSESKHGRPQAGVPATDGKSKIRKVSSGAIIQARVGLCVVVFGQDGDSQISRTWLEC